MNTFALVVGGVLPYLITVVFLAGMIYRFASWFRTPQPGKMTLFPAPTAMAGSVVAEALFFPSLFKGDRVLWVFSWVFHATLGLVVLGHVRVFTALIDRALMALGMGPEAIGAMSAGVGGAAGIVLLGTGGLLLVRRLALRRVRQISGAPDFFALLLLIGIIATGDLMRFGAHFDLAQTRVWAWSLLTFAPEIPEDGTFLIHALLAMLLIMYIPFSKILHFGGIFFTQALVKRS